MKIKNLSKILAILCVFVLLCGCANDVNPPGDAGTENSSEYSSAPQDSTNSLDNSSESSEGEPDNSSNTPEPQPVDLGNGMTLTGALLDKSELEEFSLEPYIGYYLVYDFNDEEKEFFDSLGNPELKDLYQKGKILFSSLTSTWNIVKPGFAADKNNQMPARITISDGRDYHEARYTYESFYNAYLSVFTAEAAEELFGKYDFFLDYNGALFCRDIVSGGNLWAGTLYEVRREYELISKSDTAVEFRMTVFNHDFDFKPAEEYIPELRDEYLIDYIDFKLVLTEDGWRFMYPKDYQSVQT